MTDPHSEWLMLRKIAADAYGRYQAGFSVDDAIEASCCGHGLDPSQIAVVESQVFAQICQAAQGGTGALQICTPQIEHARADGRRILPVLDRAREAKLHDEEAAILAAAAYYDPLWALLDEISEYGKRIVIGPVDPHAPELANQQSALAKQIAKTSLDDRLVAIVHARSGDFSRAEIDALAAATICVEIRTALAQVRMSVTLSRGVD